MDQVQTQNQVSAPRIGKNFMRTVLQANAIFSEISGLFFIVAAGWLATFSGTAGRTLFGLAAPTIIMIVGITLLLFGAFTFYVARRQPLIKPFVWEIIALDISWVVGSVLLIVTDAFSLTTAANWTVLIIADIVLAFAILQVIGLRRYQRDDA